MIAFSPERKNRPASNKDFIRNYEILVSYGKTSPLTKYSDFQTALQDVSKIWPEMNQMLQSEGLDVNAADFENFLKGFFENQKI